MGFASADWEGRVRTIAAASDPGPNPGGMPATYQAYTWELEYFAGPFAPGRYRATVSLFVVRAGATAAGPGWAAAAFNVLVEGNACTDIQSPSVAIVSSAPSGGPAVVSGVSMSAELDFQLARPQLDLVVGAGSQSYASSGIVSQVSAGPGSGMAMLRARVASISVRPSLAGGLGATLVTLARSA